MLVRRKCLPWLILFLFFSAEAMAADSYKKLEAEFGALQGSGKKSTGVDGWKKLQQRFVNLATGTPSASAANSDAASASFMAARCQNEVSKITHSFPDYRKAAADYGDVYKKYPKSAAARRALYQKAAIEVNPLGNTADASSTLKILLRLDLSSNEKESVVALQKKIDGKNGVTSASNKPVPQAENSTKNIDAARLKSILVDAANTKSIVIIKLSKKTQYEHLFLSERKKEKGHPPGKILRLEFKDVEAEAGVLGTTPVSAGPLKSVTAVKKEGFSAKKGVRELPLTCVELSLAAGAQAKIVESSNFVKIFVGQSDKELASLLSKQKNVSNAKNEVAALAKNVAPTRKGASARTGRNEDPKDTIFDPNADNDPSLTAPVSFNSKQEEVADQLGLTVKNVLIDPGHGGHDPGASGNGIVESKAVLKLARMLEIRLKKKGYNVTYTRDRDVFIPLEKRTAMANRRKADLFISLHVNSSPNTSASGIEAYYLDKAKSKSAERVAARENGVKMGSTSDLQVILTDLGLSSKMRESRALAGSVLTSMVRQTKGGGYYSHGNGVRSAPFYVLVGAKMPSILVEVGYCSNKADAKDLAEDVYLGKLADGIANGITLYRNNLVSSIK